MIDLTRRKFIKNIGFVGTSTFFCGSSLFAQDVLSSHSDSENAEENILANFSKSSYSDAFLFDSVLLDCYKKAVVNWEKIGYQASGDFCYSSLDNHLKMFPMHLHIDSHGTLDNVLLCFGKNQNGEWKVLKTLSGFDLEVISVAMKELKAKNKAIDLTDYLFPAPEQQLNPYGFETKMGNVFLKTIMSSGQTSTKIIVTEGTNIVYQRKVVSQHSLFVNSVLV